MKLSEVIVVQIGGTIALYCDLLVFTTGSSRCVADPRSPVMQ